MHHTIIHVLHKNQTEGISRSQGGTIISIYKSYYSLNKNKISGCNGNIIHGVRNKMKVIQENTLAYQNKVVVHQHAHGELFLSYYQKQSGK